MRYIVNLNEVNSADINKVGGKNASIGEMIQHLSHMGVNVPNGFATTAEAYQTFISRYSLDKKIADILAKLKTDDIKALNHASQQIRRSIIATPFSFEFEEEIAAAFSTIDQTSVAVRSSATAEDLEMASFAGQQETFLNVNGLKNVLRSIKLVFASLFTSRAISYRYHHGFDHYALAISVGVQPMIRSDKGASGVIFTLDTESGFDSVILITASYGLGEAIVQGQVNPDEFYVYKPMLEAGKSAILQRKLGDKSTKMIYARSSNPRNFIKSVPVLEKDRQRFCITDQDIETLAHYALLIEKHYQKPMDIEWAKDGISGKIYILQARPETVSASAKQKQVIERYSLMEKGKILAEGQSIGQNIGDGMARIILDPKKVRAFKTGEVLVTDMTDPDWEPIMKQASAIITNRGGRTCHAAIIARELGIPAVVGCGNATTKIKENTPVTVSCAEGQTGYIYAGRLHYQVNKVLINEMPDLPLKLSMNMGSPDRAFANQFLPNDGVGLARLEFIISNMIGIHPAAILNIDRLPKALKQAILKKTAAYKNPIEYYVERLREGIAMIAAAFYPKQVIFRFSDFKSNEYANLLGGDLFEEYEENPMIGFRGASRYRNAKFQSCFELECLAFKRVRTEMGLLNTQVMIPFVRTISELQQVLAVIEEYGLKRGEDELKIYMMCEVPSNALLAAEFLKYVDGFSIGSNDLTQLVLGLDRDSNLVASLFDERNEAIKMLLSHVIRECKRQGKYIGICGQAPSDHPDFAEWIMREGIEYISLNPDTIVSTWLMLAEKNKERDSGSAKVCDMTDWLKNN